MATLKGAYQRFVTSLIRLWKREEPQDSDVTNQQESSSVDLSDEETPEEEETVVVSESQEVKFFLSPKEDQEPCHSAPDLLVTEAKYLEKDSPVPTKKRSNLKRGLSLLKFTQNRSTPNLQEPRINQAHLRPRNNSSPVLLRKASRNLLRPQSAIFEVPSFQLQPSTPVSSRESSPLILRRDLLSSNLQRDHPPAVLRRNFSSSQRNSPSTRLRREQSVSNLLRRSPGTHPQRKQRPKSVSDLLTPTTLPEKPKLKKSPTFLKLSPSVFRKPTTKSPTDGPEQENQTSPRLRTQTLASRFSKFASKRIDGTLRRRNKNDARSLNITIMEEIEVAKDRTMPVEPFIARLRDYNTYYEDRPGLQFKWKQDKAGNHLVDGTLNIYWGLKRAIRLQMADSGVKIRPQSQLGLHQAEAVRKFEEITTGEALNEENVDIVRKNEKLSGTLLRRKLSRAMESTRNGGDDSAIINVENGILGDTRHRSYDRRRMALRLKNGGEKVHVNTEDSDGLLRQKSVVLRKRMTNKSGRKRFSINGHAYNYQTSVFTPAYGSVTNVRVTSKSSCDDVIKHLLNKFRVENTFEEFSLYLVKESGERRELSREEFPLVTRVLSGPNEHVSKIFVMDRNMHEDISSDVAQYIKLDLNILTMFVKKFTEEEERETSKMRERYEMYRNMLERRIKDFSET